MLEILLAGLSNTRKLDRVITGYCLDNRSTELVSKMFQYDSELYLVILVIIKSPRIEPKTYNNKIAILYQIQAVKVISEINFKRPNKYLYNLCKTKNILL